MTQLQELSLPKMEQSLRGMQPVASTRAHGKNGRVPCMELLKGHENYDITIYVSVQRMLLCVFRAGRYFAKKIQGKPPQDGSIASSLISSAAQHT